jgi:DNA-binding NarL/FixJ family response regulator
VPCRVVIADDAEETRMLLRMCMETDGRFEIVGEAANGAEAIFTTGDVRPDAVILDVAMPVMDGREAIEHIRAASPTSKIVVFSALPPGELAADASVGKDHSVHELLTTVIDLTTGAVEKTAV